MLNANSCGPMQNMDYYTSVHNWSVEDVLNWLKVLKFESYSIYQCVNTEQIDGEVLLTLTESDIHDIKFCTRTNYGMPLGEMKKLWLAVNSLQNNYFMHQNGKQLNNMAQRNDHQLANKNYNQADNNHNRHNSVALTTMPNEAATITTTTTTATTITTTNCNIPQKRASINNTHNINVNDMMCNNNNNNNNNNGCHHTCTSTYASDTCKNIPPELFKTLISLGYSFLVTWITSFVMVIVHERVPDMKRYPPLPDIFLDNVPHIPWAFHMCEITGTLLFAIWTCVIIFHKYRTVLLRRFFALAGTVFLLRCVTMLITSLSVPGTHLQCDQNDYAIDDKHLGIGDALTVRVTRAYIIWSGLGMSIQGVRTCGDYMFSGHTVALTLLNFFITEYTPRNLYFLHTLTWLLNMFGIFFILAAHEHYSIDVFVAFYITSRLFLYYHTLANNHALMSQDSNRTRIWFPMFSYFESSVEGIVPNEYDSLESMTGAIMHIIMEFKEACMLTTRRIWLHPHNARLLGLTRGRNGFSNAATSTTSGGISNNTLAAATSQLSSNSNTSLLSAYWMKKIMSANLSASSATHIIDQDDQTHVNTKKIK